MKSSMGVSIKELRIESRKVFDVIRRGGIVAVYYHKKRIADIIPVKHSRPHREPYGFGMWEDNTDTADVLNYARSLRKGRKNKIEKKD